jgi:hypothetical protein
MNTDLTDLRSDLIDCRKLLTAINELPYVEDTQIGYHLARARQKLKRKLSELPAARAYEEAVFIKRE